MVNSRCVVGSSTGMRLFSESARMKNETSARSGTTPNSAKLDSCPHEIAPQSEELPLVRISAAKASKVAGSARMANSASRFAPMPSNADAVSSEASKVANRASPNR